MSDLRHIIEAQQFDRRATVGQENDGVAGLVDTEVAMGSFGSMHENRRGSRTAEGRGNLAAHMSRFA